jgi:endonuclease/exonuclease/phosphatase family metal-dependent hydrolase
MEKMKDKAAPERKKRRGTFWKVLLGILLALIILIAGGLLALTLSEYRPEDVEKLGAPGGENALEADKTLTVVSFNIGYAALGEDADFFLDGGKTSMPESASVIETNLVGIEKTLRELSADVYLIQEADTDSKRSYGIDEAEHIKNALGLPMSFAFNYSAPYVPYPIPGMLGKVHSGLATYTDLAVTEAERIQLPITFSWPIRTINLKRCMLVDRVPLDGGRELVIVNVHLEAYDDGEGKLAQTKQVYEFLTAEAEKGNYVIVGGDFNQTFAGAKLFPATYEGVWMPSVIDDDLPEGYSFVFDAQEPTCRLLDRPYKGNDNPMYYIIDGFIVSSNLTVESLEVIDTGFVYSDHRPLKLVVSFE